MSNYEEIRARHVALTQQIMNALRANRFIIDELSGDDTWTGDELLLAPLTTDGHDPYKFAENLAENLIVMFGEKVFIGAYIPASVVNNYNLTVNRSDDASQIKTDFDLMKLLRSSEE